MLVLNNSNSSDVWPVINIKKSKIWAWENGFFYKSPTYTFMRTWTLALSIQVKKECWAWPLTCSLEMTEMGGSLGRGAVIQLHVQSDILYQENKGKSDRTSLSVSTSGLLTMKHTYLPPSLSLSPVCLFLFVSVSSSACLCLSVPFCACLCLPLPVSACLCLFLPVSSCLCLSLSPGSSLQKQQGVFLEFTLSYFKYHNVKKCF